MNTAFFASPFRLIICLVTYCVVARAMSRFVREVPRLKLAEAALLICDVQVKFESLIYRSSSVIDNIALLNGVANLLNIPVIVTEQYPKVFGPTSKVRYFLDLQIILRQCWWLSHGWDDDPDTTISIDIVSKPKTTWTRRDNTELYWLIDWLSDEVKLMNVN